MEDERVTWTDCPRCGEPAVIGWRIVTRQDGTVREDPVAFSCDSDCTVVDLGAFHPRGRSR